MNSLSWLACRFLKVLPIFYLLTYFDKIITPKPTRSTAQKQPKKQLENRVGVKSLPKEKIKNMVLSMTKISQAVSELNHP